MQKILVTGSNGLLGQKITAQFLQEPDFILIATSRGENRYPVKEGYTYIPLDITNTVALKQVIRQVAPDCIIHTAAMANPDLCEQHTLACDAGISLLLKTWRLFVKNSTSILSTFLPISFLTG